MTKEPKHTVLSGISISPGLAMGTAFVFRDILEGEPRGPAIAVAAVEQEHARIARAMEDVLRELKLSATRIEEELGTAMADIFRAHEEMLQDVTLAAEIRTEVEKELLSAEHALQRVLGRWERKFRSMESDVLKRRGDDVVDLGRRLLRSLAGVHAHSLETMPKESILVARRLLPSDTTFFSCRSAAGVVVETGGPGSHCALLTRQMGIPGVVQVPHALERIATGDVVLLDALRGTVTVAPDEASQARFRTRMLAYRQTAAKALSRCHEPAVTRDGLTIPVMANIGNRLDAEMAVQNGADGVGLFRIEVFFLSRRMLPSEDELVSGLAWAIAPMKGKPVSIRLLDIGGDKVLPYLPFPVEPNPFLGRRGVRLLLHYPDLLNTQLRALLRLSQEQEIQIIVPMVTTADDMRQVRQALQRAAAELGGKNLPRLGAMIETPAAALCAHEIAAVSDLLNVGTNDLTQYTMAADRENALVSRYFRDDHPAVLKLLEGVGAATKTLTVGACGELAGRAEMLETLLRARIRMLSVPPPLLPLVKEAVRNARVGIIGDKGRLSVDGSQQELALAERTAPVRVSVGPPASV